MTATNTTAGAMPFTSPARERTVANYPLGGSKRGPCRFWVERHPARGERVVKQTFGKPKADTYGHRAALVDGADGRTYALVESRHGGMVTVRRVTDFCDAKVVPGKWGTPESAVFPDDPHYAELMALLNAAAPTA